MSSSLSRPRVTISFSGDSEHVRSLTKQSFASECDINNIVARYVQTGDLAALNAISNPNGVFMDASRTQDFKAAMDTETALSSIYESRPDLKRAFSTYGAFMAAFEDADQATKLVKLGLLGPKALKALEAEAGSSASTSRATAESAPADPSTARKEAVTSDSTKGGDKA